MKAIHVNWTAPFFNRERLRGHGFKVFKSYDSKDYFQPEYSILTTLLSALHWKKNNGPIKLYTDSVGLQYYKEIGILGIYDEVNTDVLDNYKDIDPAYFWTSGKIRCLKEEKDPFVFLDQDFIVRNKIPDFKDALTIGHWEIPRGYYYFTKEQFEKEIIHCSFPENYDVNSLVPNTSFLAFNDMAIRDLYVHMHLSLVKNKGNYVPEWFWLLTDQGILGHAIRRSKTQVGTLTDRIYLSDSNHSDTSGRKYGLSEPWYSFNNPKPELVDWEHLWYLKAVFSDNPDLKKSTEDRYKNEIALNFPLWKR
jgi:hypothetical protein